MHHSISFPPRSPVFIFDFFPSRSNSTMQPNSIPVPPTEPRFWLRILATLPWSSSVLACYITYIRLASALGACLFGIGAPTTALELVKIYGLATFMFTVLGLAEEVLVTACRRILADCDEMRYPIPERGYVIDIHYQLVVACPIYFLKILESWVDRL